MSVSLPPVSVLQPISTWSAPGPDALAPKQARTDVAQEFEAFVLQTFIQEMLPKNAEQVFGRGIAGDIWRSLLAEKFATELAHRGGLGIAEQVRLNGSGGELRAATEAARLSRDVALRPGGNATAGGALPVSDQMADAQRHAFSGTVLIEGS